MNNVVAMKPKQTDALIENVKQAKKAFIPPKKKMRDSIENDAQYLNALGNFIREANMEMQKMLQSKKNYQAAKIQVEILDAIGKYQANEGIVNDKSLHYEKVFLPRYEKELEESAKCFDETYTKSKGYSHDNTAKSPEKETLSGYLKKELAEYDGSDIKDDEEYRNHVYKILKRLNAKYEELSKESV